VLRALDIGAERVAEVLEEMGVLIDDRRPAFEGWLERKLDGLAPGISREVEAWQRVLHDGGPRIRARDRSTCWNYLNSVRPALVVWSGRYHHLREVTRDDVLVVLATLHGPRRSNTLVGLRSLFAACKKNGTVFRNPTSRIKVGEHGYGVIIQPLRPADVADAVATATSPAARLVVALAQRNPRAKLGIGAKDPWVPAETPSVGLNSGESDPLRNIGTRSHAKGRPGGAEVEALVAVGVAHAADLVVGHHRAGPVEGEILVDAAIGQRGTEVSLEYLNITPLLCVRSISRRPST
jgi:hypothetical protein